MREGEDESASTTPQSSFLLRLALGWTILAAAAIVLSAWIHLRTGDPREAISWMFSSTVMFAAAYGLVLQFRLALIVAISVPGGTLVASGLLDLAGLTSPSATWSLMFGLVVALLAVDSFVERVRFGVAPGEAALESITGQLRPALSGLASAVFFILFVGLASGRVDKRQLISLVVQLVVASVFVVATVPAAASCNRYDEAFLTRVSRARERHMAAAYPLTFVAINRWGLSVTGIWLVVVTLSVFGARLALTENGIEVADWIGVLVPVFACAMLAVGAWRGALACLLAECAVGLVGLWALSRVVSARAVDLEVWIEAVSAAFVLVIAVATRARSGGDDNGDEEAVGRVRSIEDLAGVVTFGTVGLVVAQFVLLPPADAVICAFAVSAGLVAALLFAPALTTAIFWLLPRRRSLAELYGKK